MKRQKEFYPDYLIEILLVVFLIVELIVILALLFPPAIGREIDFSTPFNPRPEWYFLWLYQLIRYFPGNRIVIGTTVIPLAIVLFIIFIPFIDKCRWGRLKVVTAGMVLLLLSVILTCLALLIP